MARLRIGTCSWKFPSWRGLVYPAWEGINFLESYARRYDTVEIDRWFWSLFGENRVALPNPADVEEYRRSVPDDFVFTVKAPNSVTLTHFYKKVKGEPLVENPHFLSPSLFSSFLSRLAPLGQTLGPVMFQLEYLNKQKMPSQYRFQEHFEGFLSQAPTRYRYGLEVRNARYLNQSFFEFLLRNRLHPVLLQGYWMPSITDVYANWRSLIH